jgi:hypothetical protein
VRITLFPAAPRASSSKLAALNSDQGSSSNSHSSAQPQLPQQTAIPSSKQQVDQAPKKKRGRKPKQKTEEVQAAQAAAVPEAGSPASALTGAVFVKVQFN